MRKLLLPVLMLALNVCLAQNKKPLTHDVYDGWKSVGERTISNDGNYILYAINPQEGDGEMIVQNVKTGYKKSIARGYNGVITEDKICDLENKACIPGYKAGKDQKEKS